MTTMENSMECLIMTFHRYAKDDGDKRILTKKELKKLLETELPNFLKAQNNPEIVDSIMTDLDLNKDAKLDFQEFIPLITGLSMACEKCYNLSLKKGKK